MPLGTSWYYKPVNSPMYPSLAETKKDFLVVGALSPRRSKTPRSSRDAHEDWRTAVGRPGSQSVTPRYRTPEDEKSFLCRIRQPTMSSRFRQDCPRLGFTYTNRYLTWDDHYLWHKLDYFSDNSNCLWSRHGSLRPPTRT